MVPINRKTTPRVRAGRVQKKNNWDETPNYYNTVQKIPLVDRRRPGPGFRHLLKQRDIHTFIDILPDWQELSTGLDAIVLAPGEFNTDGYHTTGCVYICAWDQELWQETRLDFFDDHQDIFDRLGLLYERREDYVLCKWSEPTIRAYQLLHILLHELGHHHDRITTRSMAEAARGEPYAEAYARQYADRIWGRYFDVFGF